MADNLNRLSRSRFFCHRCLTEFRGISQEYVCPYCHTGFIEQLEAATGEYEAMEGDYDDAAMSNLDDMQSFDDVLAEEDAFNMTAPPMLNDVALLLSGGQLRATAPETGTGPASDSETSGHGTTDSTNSSTANPGNPRRPTLMEELVWMIGGSRPPPGAMTAGAPFVLVGSTPGDYVFGGEGLDAVVTQLLGQLEHSGPPPLPRERLAAIPTEQVTEEQAAANIACSVCWENFQLGETTSRLICEHVFHQTCIEPWLQLHATCPICRRSLLQPSDAPAAPPATGGTPTAGATTTNTNPTPTVTEARIRLAPRVIIRRATVPHPSLMRRFPSQTHTWDSRSNTSTSGSSPASSVTAGGLWAPQTRNNTSGSNNSSNTDLQYNTDIDYD